MQGDAREKAPPTPTTQQLAALGTQAAPSQQQKKPGRVIVKVRTGIDQGLTGANVSASGAISASQATAASGAAGALLNRHGARSAAPLFAARQRRKQSGMTEAQIDARTRQRFAARAARAPSNAVLPDLSGFYVLDLGEKSPAEVQAALAALRADPEVLSAHEDQVVKATFAPNDPSYPELWAMPKVRANTAWDTARGLGVTVAVVDTGIDYNHSDLTHNIWLNPGEIAGNGLDDDGNGLVDDVRGWDYIGQSYTSPTPDNDPMDVQGHGTHVAGTIAAEGNNGLGVIGVAWQAKVMALRGLGDDGFGLESTLAPAIVYAADEGADVINASWGGPGQSPILEQAIEHASGLGALFVAAAGNNSADVSTFYPANAPRALAVGATKEDDGLASFTNTGNKLDVVAPGVAILSTSPGNFYFSLQGTSMAAPHVSGAAALIVQLHPTYTAEQIRQVLRTSAIDFSGSGFNPWYGYGRLDAANAVAATQVPLEAKFISPRDGSAAFGPTALVGSARGPGFHHYVVEIGTGQFPTTFTQLHSSSTPVASATLFNWNPSSLPDDIYTLRLRVFTTSGAVYQDRIQIRVQYLLITSPAPNPLPAFTDVVKAGSTINITGRATGPSFISYNLRWAPGRDATSGFSTSGITLAVPGGTTPIQNGLLGTWATPTTKGEYTVKLTVVNNGFSSTTSSTVYLEPDLVSAGWPKFVVPGGHHSPMMPARMPDGTTRMISCAYPNPTGSSCRSFATDGGSPTVAGLEFGNYSGPSVGQLDNLPGDEVLIADGRKLRIFTASLSPIREIVTPRDESFTMHRVFLSDLDGDGIMEIIATARSTPPGESGWFYYAGSIHVYRADGTLYSPNYPRALTSPRMPNGLTDMDVIAVDLNSDGQKELVVSFQDRDYTVYDLLALRADGSDYPWPTVTFSGGFGYLRTSDLDHDGHPELAWQESVGGNPRTRVLNHNGTTRPGWPVSAWGEMAIGDLDRDGREEIVLVGGPYITALEPDGTIMPVAWPSLIFNESPRLVDVDNDSFPDLVFGTGNVQGSSAGSWFDPRMVAVSRTGSIIKEWRFFGMEGRQAIAVVPSIGDFTGDGKTDIAVKVRLTEGGGMGGVLLNDELVLLTNHTPFNPAHAHWPFPDRDPQQSRTRLATSDEPPIGEPPTIVAGPSASPNPVTGTTTTLSVAGADDQGEPALTYTWSVVGTPPGPVSFSANGTNAAKSSLATFDLAGSYNLQVVLEDADHQIAVGGMTVTVAQTLTTVQVGPPTASVAPGATQQFIASALDQFGGAFTSQPTFTWTVSGGGTISPTGLFTAGGAGGGPFTVTATSGGQSGTAQVTVVGGITLNPVADAHVRDGTSAGANYGTVTPLEIKNSTAAGNNRRMFLRFAIDGLGSNVTDARLRLNGKSVTTAKLVGVYAVSSTTWGETTINYNNAPARGAKQGASKSVGLAAADVEWDVTSYVQAQRSAGVTAVTFELRQDAGNNDTPTTFASRESASGKPQLVVSSGGGTDAPPIVAVAPSASPNPVTGATANLSVLGADDRGEAALGYFWSVEEPAPGPVGWRETGTNTAKNNLATFSAAGTYHLVVTIVDTAGQTVSAPLTVTVSQTLTTVAVTPTAATVAVGGTQPFTATALDQFGTALASQPTFTWTVTGGGAISAGGLFTAGATSGGPFTVKAASGGKSGTAQVTVTGGGGTFTLNPVADAYVRDGTSAGANYGTVTPLEAKNSTAAGNNRRMFLRFAVDGFGSGVTQAKLRLYGKSVTTAKLVGVHAVASTTWDEATINYNNAPARGAKQGTSKNVGLTAAAVEWDLTGYIRAQKLAGATAVTLEVRQDVANNDTPTTFNSRESTSNKPQLIVTSN
jgi:subtilisin family serine protease